MTVKEVLALAVEHLARADLQKQLEELSDNAAMKGELASLLRAYNLVENELAVDVLPLKAEETLSAARPPHPVERLFLRPCGGARRLCFGVRNVLRTPKGRALPAPFEGREGGRALLLFARAQGDRRRGRIRRQGDGAPPFLRRGAGILPLPRDVRRGKAVGRALSRRRAGGGAAPPRPCDAGEEGGYDGKLASNGPPSPQSGCASSLRSFRKQAARRRRSPSTSKRGEVCFIRSAAGSFASSSPQGQVNSSARRTAPSLYGRAARSLRAGTRSRSRKRPLKCSPFRARRARNTTR